jgi:hypothetical protein
MWIHPSGVELMVKQQVTVQDYESEYQNFVSFVSVFAGKRGLVLGLDKRGRVNVMGGLRYSDKKRLCYFVNQGNADTFYQQLKQLNEFVLQEWVAQGNFAEYFHLLGPSIIIILDNASYHKRQDIRTEIEANLPNIILKFLPALSHVQFD